MQLPRQQSQRRQRQMRCTNILLHIRRQEYVYGENGNKLHHGQQRMLCQGNKLHQRLLVGQYRRYPHGCVPRLSRKQRFRQLSRKQGQMPRRLCVERRLCLHQVFQQLRNMFGCGTGFLLDMRQRLLHLCAASGIIPRLLLQRNAHQQHQRMSVPLIFPPPRCKNRGGRSVP